MFHPCSLNEELGDWDDLLPYLAPIDLKNISKVSLLHYDTLPTLEELLQKKVFKVLDPERELFMFLRKKRFIDQVHSSGSANSSASTSPASSGPGEASSRPSLLDSSVKAISFRDSSGSSGGGDSRIASKQRPSTPPPGASAELQDEVPTPPEDLQFLAMSKVSKLHQTQKWLQTPDITMKREKCLSKLEDMCKKAFQKNAGVRMLSRSLGRSSSSAISPRGGGGSGSGGKAERITMLQLMRENVLLNSPLADPKKKKTAITNLFSSAASVAPAILPVEEYSTDWVCAFVVFFYNKTLLIWNSCKCDCSTMEAGCHKWLWRSAKTGYLLLFFLYHFFLLPSQFLIHGFSHVLLTHPQHGRTYL